MPRRRCCRRRRSGRTIAAAAIVTLVGLGSALVFLPAVGAQPATQPAQGIVTTSDGRTLEGEITDTGGPTITVNVRGVSSTLYRDDVASIDYASFADRFQQRLGALDPHDIAGRTALAREALSRSEFQLAFTAIDSALAIDPLDRDARRLAAFATRQMALEQASSRPAAVDIRPSDVATDEPTPAELRERARGLNARQINRLRQLELQPGDHVRVRFLNNVRKRYVDSQAGGDIRAFIRRDDVDQALQILEHGTRDMIEDVQVGTDPAAIQSFNRRIHGAIVGGCATSACHGGENAGSFRLIGGRINEQTMLTNYFLLMTYHKTAVTTAPAPDASRDDRSPFAGGAVDMVERTRGDHSLLYQFVLPRQYASVRHPTIRGWDGLVHNANDRLARDIVDWMNVDLASIRPDYSDIDYTLPSSRDLATDQPATSSPATEPTTDAFLPTP